MRFFKCILILIICLGTEQIALPQYYLKTKSDSTVLEGDSVQLSVDGYRGTIIWQASIDLTNWIPLNEIEDTLAIRIDSTAYYRAVITDGTCEPVMSDTVKVIEKVIETNSNQFTVDSEGGIFLLPSGIKVKIPKGAVIEPKEIKLDFISADSVNSLAAISITESTSFLSGFSFATDTFDFRKPIKIKIPIREIDGTGITILYELNKDVESWVFSDETIIVSPKDKFIEIILKGSEINEKLKNGEPSLDNFFRSFYLKHLNFPFLENPCKWGGYESRSLDLSYNNSSGCVASSTQNRIIYFDCDASLTESYEATEISPSCEPQLTISPSNGCIQIKRGEQASIQLHTKIGNIPLAYQAVTVSTTNTISAPSHLTTLSDGSIPLIVDGDDAGEAIISISVEFDYYLSTIKAIGAGTSEVSPYGNVLSTKPYTLCAIVYDLPEVVTSVSDVECETATVGGSVINDWYSPVTERGVILNGAKLSAGSGMGEFSIEISSLKPGETYSVMSYATNEAGTAYGAQMSFEPKCVPIVSTTFYTNEDDTRAFAGGEVTEDFEEPVVERGVYLDNLKLPIGEGLGSFEAELFDLMPNKTYTLKAYATNSAGEGYGEEIDFVLDVDGNIYRVVTIGEQDWISENLKTTNYNDGTSIEYITDPKEWGVDHISGYKEFSAFYCWYDNDISHKKDYGALYNWLTVETAKLCPSGWHVPSKEEYLTLIDYVGGAMTGGGKLKETGTLHWNSPNIGATDEFGFTALPGGYRKGHHFPFYEEDFMSMGEHGVWWTSTIAIDDDDFDFDGYIYVGLSHNYQDGGMSTAGGTQGASIRCIKD